MDESLQTLRFATQASHVKNQVAKKAKKDKADQDEEDIEDAGNVLELTGGCGEIALPDGSVVAVQGKWNDDQDSPVFMCLHDSGGMTLVDGIQTASVGGSQFAELITELGEKAGRIIAPTFAFKPVGFSIGKTMDSCAAQLRSDAADVLAVMDWLGVPKAYFVG
jgi:hypothetical protein